MEPAVIVAIITSIIAFLGFAFGVYKHFSTRKVARLVYEVSQISDYGVPNDFLLGMSRAPVTVVVESSGNRRVENVMVEVKTKSEIEKYKVEPEDAEVVVGKDFMKAKARSLNPTQTFKAFLDCSGNPSEDQIESLEVTHSEGVGVNKRSSAYTKLSFRFLFTDFEFDLNSRTLQIVRLGPWHFR